MVLVIKNHKRGIPRFLAREGTNKEKIVTRYNHQQYFKYRFHGFDLSFYIILSLFRYHLYTIALTLNALYKYTVQMTYLEYWQETTHSCSSDHIYHSDYSES